MERKNKTEKRRLSEDRKGHYGRHKGNCAHSGYSGGAAVRRHLGQASQEIRNINKDVPGEDQEYVYDQAHGNGGPFGPMPVCKGKYRHQPDSRHNPQEQTEGKCGPYLDM